MIEKEWFILEITRIAQKHRINKLYPEVADSIARYIRLEYKEKYYMIAALAEIDAMLWPKLDGEEIEKRYNSVRARIMESRAREAIRKENASNIFNTAEKTGIKSKEMKETLYACKLFYGGGIEKLKLTDQEIKIITEHFKNSTGRPVTCDEELFLMLSKRLAGEYWG